MDTPKALTEGTYRLPQSPLKRLVLSVLGDGRGLHQLSVDASMLHVHTSGVRGRAYQVPLETLTGIRVIRGKLGGLLTIESGELVWNFRLGRQTIPAEDFVALVRQRCSELPNGDLVLATIDAREAVVTQLVRYRAWAIWLVAPLLACVHALRFAREKSVFDLDYFGACTRFWVLRGEVYRLLTGTWLHADMWHIGGNLVVIVWLGRAVERVLGPARLIIVMAASGLTAALGSLWLAPGGSIGASGVGMGLAASFGVLAIAYKGEMPRPLAKPLVWWAVFAILLMPTPDGPGDLAIDHAAHAAGAIGGGLVTYLLLRGRRLADVRVPSLRWAAAVCVVLHAVALGAFTARVRGASTLGELAHIEQLLNDGEVDANIVNELTWTVAIDEKAEPDVIGASLRLAEKVAATYSADTELADTVATLHHRAGAERRAAELEARALELGETATDGTIQATQLARFMTAAADKLTTTGVEIVASDKAFQVIVTDDAFRQSGVIVYAVAMREGQIQGLVRLRLADGGDAERTVPVRPEDQRGGVLNEVAQPLGIGVRYAPLLLRTGCPHCRRGSAEVTVWPVDPDVLAWP